MVHSCKPNSVYLFLHANSYASETKLPALVYNLDSFKEIKAIEINISYMYFPFYLRMICWFESLGVASWRFPNGWTWLKQPKGKNLPRTILTGITSGQVMELFAFLLLWKNIKHLALSVKAKSSYRTRNIFCKLKRCSPKLCRAPSLKKICIEDIFGQWYLIFCEWKFILNSLKTI